MVSPYLRRPLRSLEQALRDRRAKAAPRPRHELRHEPAATPVALPVEAPGRYAGPRLGYDDRLLRALP